MSAPAPSMFSVAARQRIAEQGLTLGRANLDVFAETLLELARADRNVVVVTSDSRGSGKLGPFGQALPQQVVEVGIAEQNLVGIAAGLASCGKTVFAVSPACFLTARALEQIKNDVAYSDNPVRLVGISAGVSYGALGSTHHSLHDFAALRAIHNLEIVVPADNAETRGAVRLAALRSHPIYLRFGKAPLYNLHPADRAPTLAGATILREGSDVAFIATGETVVHALLAAAELEALQGVTCRVLSMPRLKPLDGDAIRRAGAECSVVITVEEHMVNGGLGEAVAAVLLEAGARCAFQRVGIPDEDTVTGSQADIFRHYGLSMEGLTAVARRLLDLGRLGRAATPAAAAWPSSLSAPILHSVATVHSTPTVDSVRTGNPAAALHSRDPIPRPVRVRPRSAGPLILAVDQSTSATKVVLFDATGEAIDRATRDHRQLYPRAGWVEHDADEVWQNLLAAAREVLGRRQAGEGEIAGVSLTNQRETVVVFDRVSGIPLHPAIVWQCRRGDALCREHVEAGREAATVAKTGLRADAYFSASKLQWLVRNVPEIARGLGNGEALIGTIDTYLIHRLTRGAVFATDPTNASRTLLYDITRLRWDDELCEWWSVPRRALAEVRPSAASFGETTLAGLLPRPVPIRGVMGDSQASLFAQRCFSPGAAKVTFGSGSSVLLNVGARVPSSTDGAVAALAWVHEGAPTYALEGIITASGSTLTWLRDQLGLIADVDEAETLAGAVGDNGGVYLVPAFSGLGAPHWNEAARALITGMSAHSDRRHVARAALESIAYQLRDALEAMQRVSGVEVRSLHGDGGATRNAFLMQFVADITGAELRVAANADSSALGAAMMGLLGLGLVPSLAALADLPRTETIFRPRMQTAQVDACYAGWRRALDQVLRSAPAPVNSAAGAQAPVV